MSTLAIIIPYFADTAVTAFEETLASVLENRPSRCEVMVVSGSCGYSDTWNVKSDNVRLLEFPDEESPVRLLNNAICETDRSILHILLPGTVVASGWTDRALNRFDNDNIAAVAGFVYHHTFPNLHNHANPQNHRDSNDSHNLLATGVAWHSGGKVRVLQQTDQFCARFAQLAPHLGNAFFRKSALEEIQLFLPRFNLQVAYVDAALMLAELHWQIVQEPTCQIHVSTTELQRIQTYHWSRHCEQLYWRWLDWGGKGRSISRHIGLVTGEIAKHLFSPTLLSVTLGRLSGIGHFGAHRSRIAEVSQILEHLDTVREEKRRKLPREKEPITRILFPAARHKRQLADVA